LPLFYHAAGHIGDRVAPIPFHAIEAAESPVHAVSATVEQDDGVVVGDAKGLADEVGSHANGLRKPGEAVLFLGFKVAG
jgi:hypothetical protein